MTKHLPARPRVVAGLPVLRRKPGELQIGLDPRHAVVVRDVSDETMAAAKRLTGHHTMCELLRSVAPSERAGLVELLEILLHQGFLEEGTPQTGHPGEAWTTAIDTLHTKDHPIERSCIAIAVRGDGRLAVTVAGLLAGAGVGWVHVSATGTVQPEDTGTGYRPDEIGLPRLVAARRAVRRANPNVRAAQFGPAHTPDLVVLTDALVPRPQDVDALMSSGIPHLLVRTRDTFGIVGPFVVPGDTSCLRCADLFRSERDECWPHIAAQLAGQTQMTDLAGTHATAAFAVAQALDAANWLHGGRMAPVTCDATVELDLRDATVMQRGWPPHVDCACGAAQAHAEDEHEVCPKVAADDAT
ncbi:ThiF family adenylyltransferase [Actinophytocola oryzae]|uniref:Bacteriocin biosynthesis cyclodehydratase domain-containing protein n=1 Tax=Actinophytocola oryzae TaxID=502181 RepID=A0A4R7URD6_9PSEU|nr:ThiF family adenylyltransferase [Actinophytocola oryzae]TDV35396.1 bacteriocin biosynthesis cyclodehydratase domain-containing protein [Actinophytocola oryzae]